MLRAPGAGGCRAGTGGPTAERPPNPSIGLPTWNGSSAGYQGCFSRRLHALASLLENVYSPYDSSCDFRPCDVRRCASPVNPIFEVP